MSGGDIERAVVELVEVEAEKQLLEVGLVAAGGQLGHHGEQEPGNHGYMPLVRAKRSAPVNILVNKFVGPLRGRII